MFEVFHVTVHGAGHIKKGQPCEDYSVSAENETCRIFVVADGHGDSNCPRSRLGSEYICRIALEDLTSFEKSVREQGWAYKLLQGREQEPLLRQLITSIFGKWKKSVCGEFHQNPLSEEERAGCSKYISLYDRGGENRAYLRHNHDRRPFDRGISAAASAGRRKVRCV